MLGLVRSDTTLRQRWWNTFITTSPQYWYNIIAIEPWHWEIIYFFYDVAITLVHHWKQCYISQHSHRIQAHAIVGVQHRIFSKLWHSGSIATLLRQCCKVMEFSTLSVWWQCCMNIVWHCGPETVSSALSIECWPHSFHTSAMLIYFVKPCSFTMQVVSQHLVSFAMRVHKA